MLSTKTLSDLRRRRLSGFSPRFLRTTDELGGPFQREEQAPSVPVILRVFEEHELLFSRRVQGKWCGGYLARQLEWPKTERLRTLLVPPDDETAFCHWLVAEKPDAVLLAEGNFVS